MKFLALLLALLLPLPILAATISWTNPTTFSDGSPLVGADIASTKVEWAATSAFTTVLGSVSASGAATSTALAADPATGAQLCYRASTVAVAAKGGGTSVPSMNICRTKPFSNPSPPTLLDAIIAWLRRVFGHRYA